LIQGITFDAAKVARVRDLLPTTLGTAGIRETMAKELLARSVFSARVANADFLTTLKKVVDAIAGGEMDEASARLALLEALRAIGYTPEGGFPDTPVGEVPPAVRGSLEDLSSFRRLDLIVRTQADLMAGAGEQMRGHEPARMAVAPAWELVRMVPVRVPRDWPARWTIAGGADPATTGRRMVALKGDPVWGELGASGNFDDALDVDHPPFAFNSGMGWREVLRSEAEALGITGPDGETLGEWLRGETRPRVIAGELPIADPVMSIQDIDADFLKILKQGAEVTPEGKLAPAGAGSRTERRAARRAQSKALWDDARARRTNVEANAQ
jgi:hypothetical protein